MRTAPVCTPAFNDRYWHERAHETQAQVNEASTDELRGVYMELLGHYLRMASLYSLPHRIDN